MRYQQLTDYEILDNQTGLIWRRNPEPDVYTFDEVLAMASQVADETGLPWRVPTAAELFTLLDHSKTSPASDFPGMPNCGFWSSSPYVSDPDNAWIVYFNDGVVYYSSRSNTDAVRLVRNADKK